MYGDTYWDLEVIPRKLPTGDYSIAGWGGEKLDEIKLPPMGGKPNKKIIRAPLGICIERKADFDELASNLIHEDKKAAFSRELCRMCMYRTKVIIIDDASLESLQMIVKRGDQNCAEIGMRSGILPKSFLGLINTITEKYGIGIQYHSTREDACSAALDTMVRFHKRRHRVTRVSGELLKKETEMSPAYITRLELAEWHCRMAAVETAMFELLDPKHESYRREIREEMLADRETILGSASQG